MLGNGRLFHAKEVCYLLLCQPYCIMFSVEFYFKPYAFIRLVEYYL